MFCSNVSSSSEASSDSRMAVADILSSMASGESTSVSSFSTLGGYTSGIPTRTTPTLTPTTLKNIEELIELQSVPPQPIKHQHQAGFVPPLISIPIPSTNYLTENSDSDTSMDETSMMQNGYEDMKPSTMLGGKVKSTGRMGGRRPNNSAQLTPEEAERREVRRQRNKLAAARCRKRRLDHTNILLKETENLEDKRQTLQSEIQMLEYQKEELHYILEAHKSACRLNGTVDGDIKSVIVTSAHSDNLHHNVSTNVVRPTSLPVTSSFIPPQAPTTSAVSTYSRSENSEALSNVNGISLNTPSTGMFNFESYMDGGTGFTPVSSSGLTQVIPSCSTQQRNSSSDLSSPDSVNPPKLVSL